ncbi:MAG: sodium:solute symporter [Flavobacteriaceae bacterium]|nr:sodium:solute symporter [Flavobacteriaceae bacterium]
MLPFFDILVIVIYFLLISGLGYYYSKRQKNTEDFFRGGQRIPFWAAGISIFGTALSPITFMAIPAKTYSTDWSYFLLNMSIFLSLPLVILLFIPYYRQKKLNTPYEYLEIRFSSIIRLLGSCCFILYQIGRIGVILFLPSIALNLVTGVDIFLCIALMGGVSLIYTLMGGIEAVIWTDVVQVFVLMGGVSLSLILIIIDTENGFSGIIEQAKIYGKFNAFDLTLSLKEPTVWVMLFGGFFINLTTYGTDHTMVQRYLVTPTQKEAQKSLWIGALLTIPATFIFFFMGTALFVFYQVNPSALNNNFINNDAIFPWYIVSQLPGGVSGILIAAIFAAAMSSLSSSMNSGAASFSADVYDRYGFVWHKDPLKMARWTTLCIGMMGILFALFMATADIKSLWDQFNKILGLIFGSLGGVFMLGLLTKKANTKGVLIGIVVSFTIQLIISFQQSVHLLMYVATGMISCFISGYFGSLLFKSK